MSEEVLMGQVSVTFRPAYLAKVSCDGCSESMKDVMILWAGQKQIVLCGSCIAKLDRDESFADEISYFSQLHTEGVEDE